MSQEVHKGPEPFAVGDQASLAKTFSPRDVLAFAEASGDRNPIHLDEAFAANSRFGRPIVHGMLSAGLISAVLGTELPGAGSIYLSQSLRFRAPVFVGDTITATVTVRSIRSDKPVLVLETVCMNESAEVVIDGEAVMLIPG
jgi:3-hydroxybutyryl-CoA dehydratase